MEEKYRRRGDVAPKPSIWTREFGWRRPWISMAIGVCGVVALAPVLWRGVVDRSLSAEMTEQGLMGLLLVGVSAKHLLMHRGN